MRLVNFIPIILLITILRSVGFCQAPVNDNFADRIVLTGSSVSFTGTLAGATVETGEDLADCVGILGINEVTRTIWWSWTASEDSVVLLFLGEHDFHADGILQVFTGSQVYGLFREVCLPIHHVPFPWLVFEAYAGETYSIRLAGNSDNPFKLELRATNTPQIFSAPRTRTVSSNEPVLFGVVAAGQHPLTYQWMHYGTNLPGQRSPSLVISNSTAMAAGPYSVLVSNNTGSRLSPVANLNISATTVRPVLSALGCTNSNHFVFALTGEVGRAYRIESSSDMVAWSTLENWTLSLPHVSNSLPTSVVINTNATSIYTVQRTNSRQYYRAAIYKPYNNDLCRINLKHIMLAKYQLAREWRVPARSYFSESQLAPYFVPGATTIAAYGHDDPYFASNYVINGLDAVPSCLVEPVSDRLEEPLY